VTTATAAASATEDIAKYITENITEVGLARTGLALNTGVPVLIIARTFLRIGEHFESLVGFFELIFSGIVIWISIWMVLHSNAAVSFLNFSFRCASLYTQYLVKISFRHSVSLVYNFFDINRSRVNSASVSR
jgi:hypothetical protein